MHRPGLVHILTPRLEALLRAVASDAIPLPLTPPTLMLGGFQDIFDQLGALSGIDAAGVRACLIVALAERRARASAP